MNALQVFDLIRFAPVIAILVFAAYKDYRYGEVPNRYWLYTPIGLSLTATEFIIYPQYQILAASSMAIGVICAFAFYAVGGFGGADTKALILISTATPLTPLAGQLVSVLPVFTLMFAALMGAVYIAFRNTQKIRFIPAILIAYILSMLI